MNRKPTSALWSAVGTSFSPRGVVGNQCGKGGGERRGNLPGSCRRDGGWPSPPADPSPPASGQTWTAVWTPRSIWSCAWSCGSPYRARPAHRTAWWGWKKFGWSCLRILYFFMPTCRPSMLQICSGLKEKKSTPCRRAQRGIGFHEKGMNCALALFRKRVPKWKRTKNFRVKHTLTWVFVNFGFVQGLPHEKKRLGKVICKKCRYRKELSWVLNIFKVALKF